MSHKQKTEVTAVMYCIKQA